MQQSGTDRCLLFWTLHQVRAVLSCPAGIITSSRDMTAKVWVQKTASHEYDLTMTLYGHTDYVNALSYIPRGLVAGLPHGALVTGEHGTLHGVGPQNSVCHTKI